VLLIGVLGIGGGYALFRHFYPGVMIDLPFGLSRAIPYQRPYGMAPAAFTAYMQACKQSGISPGRITQTIGEHPLSVGYHRRDGYLTFNRQRIEYTAATDIHVVGLTDAEIQKFVRVLGQHGFAAFYRHEGKWRFNKHIHAIYSLLPMKPQLKDQVKEWLLDRRLSGSKPHPWEQRLRRQWGLRQQ
jgi:hypothetical protein